jgi:hypothetical protein
MFSGRSAPSVEIGKIGQWNQLLGKVRTTLQLGALALLCIVALLLTAVTQPDSKNVLTMTLVGTLAIALIAIVMGLLYRTSAKAQAHNPLPPPGAPPPTTSLLQRPGLVEVFREMQNHPDSIIEKLVYSAGASQRFSAIAEVCIKKGYVPVEFQDAANSEKPRDFVHSLIGQANLVIFDVTKGDPETMYELGFQRGLLNVPPEAVFLFTFADEPIHFSPFEIKRVRDENELREELRKALDALR